jgi:hypothetical protein
VIAWEYVLATVEWLIVQIATAKIGAILVNITELTNWNMP